MRVCIICDVKGWAFDRIAQGIQRYNPDPDLEIDIFYEIEMRGKRGRIFDGYDVLYAFSPFQAGVFISRGYREWITSIHMAPLHPELPPGVVPRASSYGMARYRAIMAAKRVSVLNDMQLEMMLKLRPDTVKLDVGFDPYVFHPPANWFLLNTRRTTGPLRVGWVGNPEKKLKRFDLVKKVCTIDGVELCTVAKTYMPEEGLLSQNEMADFYRNLDVYLCLSSHEGLPTPALEAAACGIPIIATPVGIMPELVENGVSGYPVSQDVEEVEDRLRYFRDNRRDCLTMGAAMYAKVKRRAWPNVVGSWIDFIRGGQ